MPMEHQDRIRKLQEETGKEKPEEVKETVREEENENGKDEEMNNEEEEEMSEEESDYEEEYEDEKDLEEKVYCHWDTNVENDEEQHSESSDKPLRLTCTFDEVVIQGIYPREDFVLANEGVYLGGSF